MSGAEVYAGHIVQPCSQKGGPLTAIYAICVVLGAVAALIWIFLGLGSEAIPGKRSADPESRFGERGRYAVAGVLGFGLGGMSASFAGWVTLLALMAAAGGAALMVLAARYLGVADADAGETG